MSTLAIATAREVFDLLRDDLVAIEQELGRDAASSVSTITEIAEYLREGGGKRIRPSLLLLASHMLGYSGPSAIRLGTVVEMVHTATLVHDDIIDGADTRRGRPSANTRWGNEKCVLAGDWLYMQAFRVALEEKNLRVLELLIGLTQQMVEGELLQIQKLGKAVSEAEYYDLIYRKTACLFMTSMRLGAVLAGSTEAQENNMATPGNPEAQWVCRVCHERCRSLRRAVKIGACFPARFRFQARPVVGARFCCCARKVERPLNSQCWRSQCRKHGRPWTATSANCSRRKTRRWPHV